MEPIEDYYDPTNNVISDMNFVIPPDFLTVIMKMNPELNLVEIHSVETYTMIDAFTFTSHEYFRVHLNIQIAKSNHPIGPMTHYSDNITHLFRYTYNECKFISFQVQMVQVVLQELAVAQELQVQTVAQVLQELQVQMVQAVLQELAVAQELQVQMVQEVLQELAVAQELQVHNMKQEPTASNREKFMELFGAAK
jgi:hypothetical protein